jgi:WD40 repeat protein
MHFGFFLGFRREKIYTNKHLSFVPIIIIIITSKQLIEAHESTLRALTLTPNGTLLATASHKGTVIRVWDVATSNNLYEFRRGVERAQITCLAFSWDEQWLSCASDKGTTHIFYCDKETTKNGNNGKNKSSGSSSASSFLSSAAGSFFSSSSKKPQPKSVCQVRGVPHPLSCAFISDAPNLIAVAGWDLDGNGVLLISEFAAHQEARRVAYHVLVKNALRAEETEEERRRRRARGWKPSIPDTPTHAFGNLQIGDMESTQNALQTQTTDDDFCEVIFEHRNQGSQPVIEDKIQQNPPQPPDKTNNTEDDGLLPDDSKEDSFDDAASNEHQSNNKETDASEKDSVTNQDSVRTEPLEEDEDGPTATETLVQ